MDKQLFAIDKNGKIKHWTVEAVGDTVIVNFGRYLGKMQEKRTVCKPKNIGKANETTAEQQAELEAQSKYNKQYDKCYRPTIEEAKEVGEMLPMLAQNYLHHGHKITYPAYASKKLDGVRCLATVKDGEVSLSSRGGKEYPCPDNIKEDLIELSYLSGISKFDGELYIHGELLQDIVSAVKVEGPLTPRIKYHIFDAPSDKSWEERYTSLKYNFNQTRFDALELVQSIKIDNELTAYILMERYVNQGYEGVMLRNVLGGYEYNYRSSNLQKLKPMQDLEAKVIGVKEDKNGEGVLTCHIAKDVEKIFEVKMKGTAETRAYNEQTKLLGHWITVQYQQFTAKGLPQFPVGLRVRDCNEKGEPNG